jgi:hypothetical protein
VTLGQRDQLRPIGLIGHRPLRIGRGADIGDRRPVEDVVRQGGIVRQIAGGFGGGHIDRLRPHGQRGDGIDLVERVRHQNDGCLAALPFRAKRHAGVEQPLARSVQRQDLPVGRDVHAIAPRDPARDGDLKSRRAVVRGVAPEAFEALRDHVPHPDGKGVTRLADGHGNGFAARLVDVEKLPQTRKRIIRQVRKPLRKHHDCLNARDRYAPDLRQTTLAPSRLSRKTRRWCGICGAQANAASAAVPSATGAPRPWAARGT